MVPPEVETEEIETASDTALAATSVPTEDAEADLESGYAEAPTDVQTNPPDSPDAQEDAPSPAPVYAKITEDEYKRFLTNAETVDKIASSLEQRFGTAFGHIGGLQQKLKEIQAATPNGQSIKFTKEDFAEMQADFPELADMQMKGLERALSRMSGTGAASGLDEAKASELFDAKFVAVERKILTEALADLHEDWEQVVGPKDSHTPYRVWLAAQPQAYQDTIHASRRPAVIAKSIDQFKAFAAAPSAATAPKPNAVAEARRAQLSAAVTPKGAGGAKVGRTEDDDLQAGFDAA